MSSSMWNPWHGCRKLSEGCRNCYIYRSDARHGKDASIIHKTEKFDLIIKRKRNGEYKIPSGREIATCFTSDFFLEEADEWRKEAWQMVRERNDLTFLMLTKRIDRFYVNLPEDWKENFKHVRICCTVENQDRADYRLPIYKDLPIEHKTIVCAPLISAIDLSEHLGSWIEEVVISGEAGYKDVRICNYEWIENIRQQCIKQNVSFTFRQTGSKLLKNGKVYTILKRLQFSQARKAGIDYVKQNTLN